LVSKYPAVWQQAVQQGFNLSAAEALITVPVPGAAPVAVPPVTPQQQLGLVAAPPPSPAPAPAMQAARLRSPAGAGKLLPKGPRKKAPVTAKQASNHG
jgi:hypothetical protein